MTATPERPRPLESAKMVSGSVDRVMGFLARITDKWEPVIGK
jgi:hypothetical protein